MKKYKKLYQVELKVDGDNRKIIYFDGVYCITDQDILYKLIDVDDVGKQIVMLAENVLFVVLYRDDDYWINKSNQLIRKTKNQIVHQIIYKFDSVVKNISGTVYCMLILTSKGHVYAMGDIRNFPGFNEDERIYRYPQLILENVYQVDSSVNFFACLIDDSGL